MSGAAFKSTVYSTGDNAWTSAALSGAASNCSMRCFTVVGERVAQKG